MNFLLLVRLVGVKPARMTLFGGLCRGPPQVGGRLCGRGTEGGSVAVGYRHFYYVVIFFDLQRALASRVAARL